MASGAHQQRIFFFIWGVVLCLAAFFGVGLGLVCGLSDLGNNAIAPGVYLEGIDVGGQTPEEALRTLAKQLDYAELQRDLVLNWQGEKWQLAPNSLGIGLDLNRGIEEAFKVGRGKGFFADLYDRYAAKTEGRDIPLQLIINEDQLKAYLQDLAKEINRQPIDAQLLTNPDDTIQIIGEKPGQRLNLARASKEIKEKIRQKDKEINLPVELWQAPVTVQKIQERGIKRLLASFTTAFSTANSNRAYNIYVAAKAIDGTMLKPGETFSFNKIVGPRSQEAGYKTAGVIVNNELVDGIGGGVCQVSSTLYNAVLLANLEIVERNNHSKSVAYLPLGRDATVAYDYLDFKFKNNSKAYVLIRAESEDGRLMIRLFGDKNPAEKVDILTEINGGEGASTVNTWRIVKKNGREIKRELVAKSTYR